MAGYAREGNVLDGVTKRPVPQVVQQGSDQKSLGIAGTNRCHEPGIVCEAIQKQQGHAIHAQRMLEAGMIGSRVNEPHESQLADLCESAKLGGVDELLDPRSERDIEFGRDSHQTPATAKGDHFGDFTECIHCHSSN